jgi:hypothetical protein
MKKIITLFAGLLLFTFSVKAQGTWTFAAPSDGSGSAGAETGRAICTDASGNVYMVGNFNGAGVATDFDLNNVTTNTFTATSTDGYIASYDKNGNFRWKTIISGTGNDFAAPSGGVCTNGTSVWVAGTANVSAGAAQIMSSTNTVTITSPGTGVDAFVAKLNCSNGAVQWQQGFGGTGGNDFAEGICLDPSGCCYVVGAYSSAFTLGSVSFPAPGGTSDFFIAKFTPTGVLRSVATGGSTTTNDMIGNGGGVCYVPGVTPSLVATGHTSASAANFGAFTGLGNFGLNDALLVELDTTLNFTNALVMGSAAADELMGTVYDPVSGGVFVSGFCSGNITFPGTAALTGLGNQDITIARYNVATNNFVWSSIAGGAQSERGWSVAADGYGAIYLSGYTASAPCTFSGSVSIAGNAGLNDLYIARYTAAGVPLWVTTAAGAGSEEARSIACYVETTPTYSQSIFATGVTNTTACPFGSFSAGNDGGNDFFLAKMNDPAPPLSATQSQVNLTCNGVCNGSATVVASGGTSPYTYSWSPSGGSGATASSLCAGSYTCTITDAAASSITKTFNITQPPALVLNANTQTNVSCFGGANGAASVVPASGGTPGYTYNWTPGNPSGDGTVSVTGLIAGTWTCTVTDANSCTTTRTFNITAPTAITVTPASQTNVSCNGGNNGAASINTPTGGAGGYTYNWTPGNPSGDGTVSVTGLTAGSWTCTVTDANSCTATQTFNITQPPALVVSALSQTNVACFGGSTGAASVTVSGGTTTYSYNWTPGNPTGDGTASVTGLIAGSWTCTVTDANSCTATQTFNITSPTAIVVTPASQTNVSCFGGTNGAASINTPTGGAGGFTYNWTPGNPTGDGTVAVSGLFAGTWTCTVTDANSCTAIQTFNITQPSAIVVTPASQTNVACNGGSTGAASINTPTGGAGGFTYNWTPGNPTGDGTVAVSGLTAGSWTCTVTDANSCTATQTFNITQATAITANISSTPTSCSANTGTATVSSVAGGAGGYTYSWAPTGGTAATATALAAGNYTCTITDANSCTITRTVTVATSSGPSLTAASQTNVACFGGATGAASVNAATGGTSPYTYNWTPGNPTGDGTVSVTGLTAGSWTCTVTDAGGCTANVTFNITQPPAITVTPASQTNVSCFGGANGAASINTPTGGAGGFTYNWTPGNPTGDGTVAVTGLTAGSWTCTVTDANSCTTTQTFNITSPTAIVVTPASQTNVSCFGGANGAASINTPTGGAGGFTYNWTPGNPTGDGTVSVTGLTAGSWTCTVTDANSCTATQTFNITSPTAIVVTPASQTNVSCNAGANGAASINTPTGGAGGFTYNWTPGNPTGDGTVAVTGLTAGSWTCTVTDANSCTATQTFNITQPTAITANISSTPTSCTVNTGTATVSSVTGGAGGYTYSWAPTGGTAATATALAAGTYTCTITDVNSCSITRTVTVTTSSGPSLTAASQTNVACFGGSTGAASVNAATGGTAPYTYNWTPGNPTGDGTVSVTGLTAGTWTCTVTDAGGCTASVTFNITQPPALVAAPASQTNVSCFGGSGGSASVSVSGGTTAYSYNWTPGNPSGDGSASVIGLTAGTWTCTVTDANGCVATQTFNITSPAAISSSVASQTNVSCFGGNNGAASITVPTGGTAPFIYNWTPGNPTGDGTTSVSGLTAGTWVCMITDASFCTATVTVNITQPPLLGMTALSQTDISCFGGATGAACVSAATGGTTPYSYNWTPGNPTGDGTTCVTGLTAGSWTCTLTDGNGCIATRTFTITSPTALAVNPLAQTNVSCFGGNNGAASVSVSGGTTAYSYNWTPGNPTGDGTASVTGLTAGTWTCTVTDANSCVATLTFNITQPPALTIVPVTQTNISCFGGNNGAATVFVTGGTPSYSYNWTPGNPTGDGTPSVSGLTAGSWTCTVTDANSCVAAVTINITSPTALVVTPASQTNVLCNGGTTGAASVTVSGGVSTYSYNWTPGNPTGDGTASVTGLTAGTWTCTVTDANSCTSTATFNITQPTAITANITSTPTSCTANTGTATVSSVSGGVSPYSYNWTPGNPTGDGTPAVTGLAVGNWTCTITDANGCSITRTVNVVTATGPTLTALSQTNILCNGNATGAASVNAATGGTTPYTYNWTPGNPTGDGTTAVTGLTAGTWTCTVTDANGCTASVTFNITQPTALAVAPASQTNVSCNAGNNGAASVTVSGGTTIYSYNWTPGNPTGDGTASVTGLTAGTWTCTVTDANGCSATQTFNITQPNALVVSPASQTNILCNGGTNGAASVTVSGGTTAYSYNWTPGNPTGDGTASVTGLSAGTYTCTVTDANNCSATATFNITQPPVLVVTPSSQTNVTCFGGNDGAATGSVTGGTPSYTYSWAPTGGNGATALGLTAGVYTLTVTDANNCSASATFNITQPPAVVVNISASVNPICAGDCSVLTATGASIYSWAPGSLNGTSVTVCPTSTTTYTVTGSDINGCIGTATLTVTVNPLPVVTITGDDSICVGDSSILTATSAGTNQWYHNGVLIPGATANTYWASASGVYNMITTNGNNCTDSAATGFTLIINALPAVTANASAAAVCDGNSVTLTGSGATSYTWDNSVTDGVAFTPLATASYVVTGTDANGCVNTDTITVTVNPLPVVALGNDTSTCAGSTILLDAGNAGATYLWNDSTTAQTLVAATSGTYWVDVTNTFGCTSRDSINLTFASAFAVTLGNDTSFCGDTLVLDAGNPGYSYLWNDSTTAQTLAAAVTGTYYVTVTDSIGCTASDSINITITNGLNVALGSDMSNCTGSAITLDAGAFNNASYMWNDSTTAQTLTANSSGTYYVTVTDSVNGCSGTDTINVSINTAPVVNLGGTISSCASSYTFDAGTSGNVYLWNDSSTAQTLTVNTAGTYFVTVTDSLSGCSSSDTANITFTVPPVVTFTLTVDSICNTEPAFAISGTPAGGVFTGFGVVNGNQFSPGIGGPGINVVTYTYTDGTGCSVSASDSLFVFQCIGINEVNTSISMNIYPNPNLGVFTIEAHSLNKGNIEVQIFNTLGQVIDAFPINDDKHTVDITGYESGIYSVRLTDGTSVLTQRVIKQ